MFPGANRQYRIHPKPFAGRRYHRKCHCHRLRNLGHFFQVSWRREITDLPEKLRFLRSRLPVHQCLPFRFALAQREVIPMEKGMEHILALFAPCHLTAVFSKQQLRHVTTPNIPQIDLSTTVILSRNPNGPGQRYFPLRNPSRTVSPSSRPSRYQRRERP